jgi:hypothetical protein
VWLASLRSLPFAQHPALRAFAVASPRSSRTGKEHAWTYRLSQPLQGLRQTLPSCHSGMPKLWAEMKIQPYRVSGSRTFELCRRGRFARLAGSTRSPIDTVHLFAAQECSLYILTKRSMEEEHAVDQSRCVRDGLR